jgi:dienelactone hydrolase
VHQHARDPIRHWITDKRGQVRLGWGLSGTTISYWANLDGESNWRRLTKFEIFSRENHFEPVAISAEDPNLAYAIGLSEGRNAIWLIDLKDREDPRLVFSHPIVDVSGPVLGRDGRLIGARYDNGYPMMFYTDGAVDTAMRGLQALRPGRFNTLHGMTRDEKVLVIRSMSDVDAPRFMVLDPDSHAVSNVGAAYPERDPAALAPMDAISCSSGYGEDWFFAAHQDWGGLTYDDVVDGARWAVQQGITDPARVCIVGWSFGGYVALLGAQRNPELFHCAVDIAGVSDLGLLIDEGHRWMNGDSIKKQIGTDPDKLKRDSPRLHAADIKVPLLMVHGKMDAQVPVEQSEVMDEALKRARIPHRFTVVPDADHQFSGVNDRAMLLRETDAFLREYLPAAQRIQ